MLGYKTHWYDTCKVKKMRDGIRKSVMPFKCPKTGISAECLLKLLDIRGEWGEERFFCALAWVFMLRAPSEAANIHRIHPSDPDASLFSEMKLPGVIFFDGTNVVIRLKKKEK